MENKDIVKHFYEVIVSENQLDELSNYISEDCIQKVGEKEIFIGIDGKIVEHGGAANTFETFFEHHLIKPV